MTEQQEDATRPDYANDINDQNRAQKAENPLRVITCRQLPVAMFLGITALLVLLIALVVIAYFNGPQIPLG